MDLEIHERKLGVKLSLICTSNPEKEISMMLQCVVKK